MSLLSHRRYITNEQRKSEDTSITEDDIQEVGFCQFLKFSNGIQEIQNDYHYHLFLNQVRQDINSFKYELLDILKNNNMKVPDTKRGGLSKDVKKGA